MKKTVRKSDNAYAAEVTSFLYDRQHVILETDGSGNTVTRYIRGINYIGQYSRGSSGGTSLAYYLYNGHGDVVQTVTAAGEIQNRYDYDIFGNPTLTIEVSACNIRYAGEYLDNETGLYYLRARYYNPNIGRFISEDSYWGEDTNPLSLNLYTYCYNNPIRFIDPTGHSAYEDIIANARKQAQVNSLIKEIDKQKEIWFSEEQGAGKNQASWTDAQTEANRKANELRQQLLQLESGNADIQKLIKDDSKLIAGAWEGYKLSVTARVAEANPSVDYSETIRRQVQDYALAVISGRNAIGIHASDIVESNKSNVEIIAEMLEVSMISCADERLFAPAVMKQNVLLASIKPVENIENLNLFIDGMSIDGAEVINGSAYADIYKLAKLLGYKVSEDDDYISLYYFDENGAKFTTSYKKKGWLNRNGSLIVGVRELAEFRGYGDTISWWHDSMNKLNVTVNPSMKYAPIKVIREENIVEIAAFINFTGDANDYFPGTVKSYILPAGSPSPKSGISYAEVAAAGIQSDWNGIYSVDGRSISLITTVYSHNASQNNIIQKVNLGTSSKQQYLDFEIKDEVGRSYQIDGNLFSIAADYLIGEKYKSGDPIYDNWSFEDPGRVALYTKAKYNNAKYNPKDPSTYKTYTQKELSNVASHEFGHLLGLGDAYGEKGYRYAAPEYYNLNNGSTLWIPSDDKMRSSQGNVSDTDVILMLKAWKLKKFQPFPETTSYTFSPGSTINQ